MKVTGLGEFGLIEALAKIVARPVKGLLVGIGDDAAVWEPSPGAELATTDILVEGVHFTLDSASWHDLGWKALAVNVSDIAAMGGEPLYALVSVALPSTTDVANIEDLYRGAMALASRYGTAIIGGDTVRSPRMVVVNVVAIGRARTIDGKQRLLRRNAARPRDIIGITSTVGGSAAGLKVVQQRTALASGVAAALREAHLRPTPRVPEAQVLLAAGVEAAMDISDGLVGDLAQMCRASGCSAILDTHRVPVHAEARKAFPDGALALALYGGEDYELLFTAPQAAFQRASEMLRAQGLAPATAIGEIVAGEPGSVRLRNEGGRLSEPAGGGYDAFRRAK